MASLNTENADQLIYESDALCITILGGIKLEGLDRLRVTLKIEVTNRNLEYHVHNPEIANLAVRHNLDLYNDSQCEKLIRKSSDRLEVGMSILSVALGDLTNALETYRLEELKKAEASKEVKITLSKKERKAAEDFLKSTDLMNRTNELIGKSGMVGEETNRLLMYLIFSSRKLKHPLHVVSLGSSGTGKTHLQDKIGSLIPEEDKVELTTLSENAFYYFGEQELKNKLILIEDLDGLSGSGNGGGGAFYALRELQSKKKISKTIAIKNSKGETRSVHLVVEGPVSVGGCTTKERIYEDNANRSFLLYLDESKEQDHKVMEYQRRLSAGNINEEEEQEVTRLLKNMQRVLQPIKVVNPYAESLELPEEILKPRRTNNHYLQFIEVVTYYHQYQRDLKADENGEAYIETTLEDIEEANKLLKETLIRKSDELTGACRNYFEKLKAYLMKKEKNNRQSGFTNRELSNGLRIPITTVKRHHLDLYNSGYLQIKKKDKLKGYEYEIVSYEEYKQLEKGIDELLEKTLEEIKQKGLKQPSSPKVAQ